jgi:acyl dehydratase
MEPGQVMGINYGFERLRFLSPVRAGQRVRGCFELHDVFLRKPNEVRRDVNISVEIEGQTTPALAARWLGLLVFDAA